MKEKIKKKLLSTPNGQLFFFYLRRIREKYSLFRYQDQAFIARIYRQRFGRPINWANPRTFTEKLQWLKLFYRDPVMPVCSDKYQVRQYLAELGFENLLTDLIGVYPDASQIDFAALPARFVAKASHGSGWNLICKDKALIDWPSWQKVMNSWLKLNLFVFGREWNYQSIPPRIIVEAFIEWTPLVDYKFMCFNGQPRFVQVNHDCDSQHFIDLYDMNWVRADFQYFGFSASERKLARPAQFAAMANLAVILSQPFPFVRVDLYADDTKILFGEMTFFPGGGLIPLSSATLNYDELFGSWLALPEPNHNLDLYHRLQTAPARITPDATASQQSTADCGR